MVKRPLGAQISHMLKDRGVDTIFGIPGVHNVEMYRGIEEAGITHVLARHEQGAGFMADGYARATGRPGVAYVITGPGLCNIMTPMGQAYSDSVPMLVISSCLDETAAKRGQLHQMKDQRAAAECVCDWSEEARTAEAAYQLVDRAFAEFRAQRARPKHIQVPIEVLGGMAEPAHRRIGPPHGINKPQREAIELAAIDLKQSKRPLFVLGGGARAGTGPIRQLIDKLGAAAFTTYAGRGVVSSEYPLNLGSYLGRPESADIIASADVVVAIGTELSEVDLWRDHLGVAGRFIHVDIDPTVFANQTNAEMQLQYLCGSYEFARVLNALLRDHETVSEWSAEEVSKSRVRWRAEVDANRPGIVPLSEAMMEVMPKDAMIYSDMTQFAYVSKEVIDMPEPGHWHHPFGFGTLGYALPAAIGGAVARRGLPTVAIAGDYGFHYTMQELGVAVELGLSLPIILWDNGKLKEIEDCMVNSQIAPNAVVARNPDFCKLAEAFGANAVKPATIPEFQAALLAAFAADGPTLIHLTPEVNG
ncbi:MAG: 5-guanidino-2-oxopentanoate decarboxylase [Rhodobacteraceae bacterium]|nr:5-guanidino-2-oxopentanoate decarboxylase [Paracoccaceae bacterium]